MISACKVCGTPTPTQRQKYCEEHSSPLSVKQKERDLKRKQEGKCRRCSEPLAETSKAFCAKHLEINREMQRNRAKIQKEKGKCKYCNNSLSPSSTVFCETHRIETNKRSLEYERAKRAKKMCADCGKTAAIERRSRCSGCQEAFEKLKLTRCQKRGCSEPLAEGLKYYCRTHADEANKKLWERRMRLKNSNKCYFCQSALTPDEIGKNSLCTRCRNARKKRS